MDLPYWCSLEGYARPLSTLPDLPPPLSGMGKTWHLGNNLTSVSAGSEKKRENRFIRNLPGWQLFSGQKGGSGVGKTKRGKGSKIMAIADRNGLPVAICTHEANTHEVKLIEKTLSGRFVRGRLKRIVADKAYDSDIADQQLRSRGIRLIAPHRSNRKSAPTQDGRELRRYRHRWKVERLFAWIHNYRRCYVRYEYYDANFLAFVHIACIMIFMKKHF